MKPNTELFSLAQCIGRKSMEMKEQQQDHQPNGHTRGKAFA